MDVQGQALSARGVPELGLSWLPCPKTAIGADYVATIGCGKFNVIGQEIWGRHRVDLLFYFTQPQQAELVVESRVLNGCIESQDTVTDTSGFGLDNMLTSLLSSYSSILFMRSVKKFPDLPQVNLLLIIYASTIELNSCIIADFELWCKYCR